MDDRRGKGTTRRVLIAGLAMMHAGLLALAGSEAAASATLIERAGGLASPIGLANSGDGSNRLFVVEQAGCIRFFLKGAIRGTPCGQTGTRFLDIRSRIASGGERGLLGLAFHPQYATNGFFFVYYTSVANGTPPARNQGDIVIARYTATANRDIADPASEQILIVIAHSQFSNHNGGHLAFGPDGFLYAAVGDGGSGGDPGENGQDPTEMLGKIHRIDVNETNPPFYTIPATNPFQSGGPGTCGAAFPGSSCDEIWAVGLRNPWRFSFDRLTGDLYIGDVGQGAWEEVNFQAAGAVGGRNYGWDVLEGAHCFEDVPAGSCNTLLNGGSTLPVLEYNHGQGFSITGGYVYRGPVTSAVWTGSYVFADWGSGRIWRGFRDGGGIWQRQEMFTGQNGITSFGEDDRGNLYFVRSGSLYELVPHSVLPFPHDAATLELIERLYAAGVTAGCGGADGYCAAAPTTREQAAALVLRARDQSAVPAPCDSARFADVASASPFCPWIEEMARRNVVAGCGSGMYCPEAGITRAQMAMMALATLESVGYAPPACARPMFADVPAASPFCPWIEELARRNVVAGCGGGKYCPDAVVNRGELAAILVGVFALP